MFQLLRAYRLTSLHECGDDLSPFLVGKTDDGDLSNRGMKGKAAFDLNRRDVLAARYNHVVDTTRYKQVAVAVDKAGIARKVPALAQ